MWVLVNLGGYRKMKDKGAVEHDEMVLAWGNVARRG
jgi:hypothetical protein